MNMMATSLLSLLLFTAVRCYFNFLFKGIYVNSNIKIRILYLSSSIVPSIIVKVTALQGVTIHIILLLSSKIERVANSYYLKHPFKFVTIQ